MQAIKKGDALFVYAILALDLGMLQHEIPIQYQDYKYVFENKNEDTLPEHWPYDCAINLEEKTQPPFGPIYNLSQDKLLVLQFNIDKNLEKWFIQLSKSPTGVPNLFVKKKYESLRMCVD